MKRKLNYTGRKKIKRQDFIVSIIKDNSDTKSFSAEIMLDEYDFPPDAKIFVEAYRFTEIKRFDFGKVSKIKKPNTDISEMSHKDHLLFTLKVVDNLFEKGKILGCLQSVRPDNRNTKKVGPKSILDVEFKELTDNIIWKLEYDEGGPILMLNTKINNIQHISKNDAFFFFNVYPAIIKEILFYIRYIEKVDNNDVEDDWCKDWIDFAERFSDKSYKEITDNDSFSDWVDSSVYGFVNDKSSLWKQLINEYGGVE